MATRTTRSSAKKQPAAVETSESIAEQTRAFLESGKKIEVVQSGVSGQTGQAPSKPSRTASPAR